MAQPAINWTAGETTFTLTENRRDILVMGLGDVQSAAYTGTAGVISNAINAQIVRVVCTTDAHVRFGDSPTAVATDTFMAAKVAEYLLVPNPGTSKLSAVQDSTGGTVYVTECL